MLAHLIYLKINENRLKPSDQTVTKMKAQASSILADSFLWQECERFKCTFQGCWVGQKPKPSDWPHSKCVSSWISLCTNRFLKGQERWKYSAGTLFWPQQHRKSLLVSVNSCHPPAAAISSRPSQGRGQHNGCGGADRDPRGRGGAGRDPRGCGGAGRDLPSPMIQRRQWRGAVGPAALPMGGQGRAGPGRAGQGRAPPRPAARNRGGCSSKALPCGRLGAGPTDSKVPKRGETGRRWSRARKTCEASHGR